MTPKGKRRWAYGYMRTSSSANVGADKDSEKRQRTAIDSLATALGSKRTQIATDGVFRHAELDRQLRGDHRQACIEPADDLELRQRISERPLGLRRDTDLQRPEREQGA